jgi:hypothetical protein
MNRRWISISPARDPLWYGLATATGALAAYLLLAQDSEISDSVVKSALISGGTLLGFMITALSIMIAVSNREFVLRLRQQGKYQNLINQVFTSISVLAITIGLGFFYVITTYPPLALAAAFGFSFSLVVVIRIGWKFKQLFSYI